MRGNVWCSHFWTWHTPAFLNTFPSQQYIVTFTEKQRKRSEVEVAKVTLRYILLPSFRDHLLIKLFCDIKLGNTALFLYCLTR